MITLLNWLLVSGTGRNVGKTTLVCRILNEIKQMKPVALKISSHLHPLPEDSDWIIKQNDFVVIRETHQSSKDSSRMLASGADISFYAQGPDSRLPEILNCILGYSIGRPVVCESGGIRNLVVPGIYFLVIGEEKQFKPGIKNLETLADRILTYPEIVSTEIEKKISFRNGHWILGF